MQHTPPEQGNKTSKTVIILLVLLIAGLVIGNIWQNMRFNYIERRIDGIMFTQISDSQNIRAEVWRGLEEMRLEVEQATRPASDVQVEVLSFNGSDLIADINVSFFLREFGPGDVVWVKAQCEQRLTSTTAVMSEAGRFSAYFTLPITSFHSLSFITEGTTIRTGALADVYLAEELAGRFSVSIGQGSSNWREGGRNIRTIRVWPFIFNDTQGNESFLIKDVFFNLESFEGELIRSWSLNTFLHNENGIWQNMNPHIDVIHDLVHHGFFDVPVVAHGGTDESTNENGKGFLQECEDAVARLVMYDVLGIRYEFSTLVSVPDVAGPGIAGFADTPRLNGSIGRVIEYGMHSWDFVRIVRR